jgi:hypothetical protein
MGQSDHVFGYFYNTRGKAWCYRNLGFATFLSPDADAWKASGRASLLANTNAFLAWKTSPSNKLDILWQYDINTFRDENTDSPGLGYSPWQHHFITVVTHKIACAKVLLGADQPKVDDLADWTAKAPVRLITESTGTEWRYASSYHMVLGPDNGTLSGGEWTVPAMNQFTTFGLSRSWNKIEAAPTGAGPWYVFYGDEPTVYSSQWSVANGNNETGGEPNYTSIYWSALVAAVERDIAGASAAWSAVNSNVTNLSAFLGNGGRDCRFNHYPRNV